MEDNIISNRSEVSESSVTLVEIDTPYITLSGFLKFCGFANTGGESKELIKSGGVLVDGMPCTERGRKLRIGSVVSFISREEVYEVAGRKV